METTQKLNVVETSEELQQRLAGEDSLRQFSIRNSYNYRTVCIVAQRWWHRLDREPHGGIAREIIAKMRVEFSHE